MKTICIAGKNEIAVNAIKYLKENFPDFNYCVITNKTDNGITGWQPSLAFTAKKLNVKEVTLPEVYDIEELIFLSLEFDLLIKPSLFKSSSLFNIHFSALPKFKGMYTSVLPILFAETSSGVTLHKIDKGIDTGDIIDQIIFPIYDYTTCKDLYQLYLDNSFELFKKNIKSLIDNTYLTSSQNSQQSSYFSKKSIDFSDLKIDLNKTAFEIHNQFRAYTFREYQLPKFKDWSIYKTKITSTKSEFKSGTIIHEDDSHFILSTVDYNILLYKDYYDMLWDSCRDGLYEQVAKILEHITNINLRNKNGWNALIISVYNNHPKIAEFLLNYSSRNSGDINSTNYKGTTVIMYAFACYKKTGDDTMMRLILSYSPDLSKRDETGRNIFDYAENDKRALSLLMQE
jgi:methionyl-tRNA formyltransferase